MLTDEEKNFILKLLNDVKIQPLDPSALQVVGALQLIAKKITALPGEEKKPQETKKPQDAKKSQESSDSFV